MEKQLKGKYLFLNVVVNRSESGILGNHGNGKPIHNNRYLHKDSNHHPAQIPEILKNFAHRATCTFTVTLQHQVKASEQIRYKLRSAKDTQGIFF